MLQFYFFCMKPKRLAHQLCQLWAAISETSHYCYPTFIMWVDCLWDSHDSHSGILKLWQVQAQSAESVHRPRVYHNLRVWPRRLTRPCCTTRSSSQLLPPVFEPLSWPFSPPWSSWGSPPCAWSGWAAPPATASQWRPEPRLLQWKL